MVILHLTFYTTCYRLAHLEGDALKHTCSEEDTDVALYPTQQSSRYFVQRCPVSADCSYCLNSSSEA